MKKEDYMRLPKERLAELLAERDEQEGSAWKEQQMIEKAAEWLEPVFKDLAGYYCGGDLINDFKKAMEENK